MDVINTRFVDLIKALDLSQNEFARVLGTSSSRVSNITTGRNKPDIEIVQTILNTYKQVSERWLLVGEGKMFKHKDLKEGNVVNEPEEKYKPGTVRALIVLDAKTAAGFPESLNGAHYKYDSSPTITLPMPQFKSGNYVVIQVVGHSMEPTILNGDWVLCRKVEDQQFTEGNIFVVVNGDAVNLKRVYREGETRLKLCSDNADFDTQIIPASKRVQLWAIEMRFTMALGKNPIVAIREQLQKIEINLAKLESKK